MRKTVKERLRKGLEQAGFNRVESLCRHNNNTLHEFYSDTITGALVILYDDTYKIRFVGTKFDKTFDYLKGNLNERVSLKDKVLDIKRNCTNAYNRLNEYQIKPID